MIIHHSAFPPQYNERKIHQRTKENIDKWINLNEDKNFTQKVWSIGEARNFLIDFSINNQIDLLMCFDRENDGRYKSDIWRLAVLYEYGGIYADIDQEPLLPLDEYLDLSKYDICLCSNMGLHNISNGFIYSKKGSKIIWESIKELFKRYSENGIIGGTHSMGVAVTKMSDGEPLKMPLGEIKIGNENCLFLHEISHSDSKIEDQNFYNSFSIYDVSGKKTMNSRYSTYYLDKSDRINFVDI